MLGKPSGITIDQCDQIGRFVKFLGNKVHAKVTQIFSNILRLLWKMERFVLNWCGYFLGNFCRKLGNFLPQHLVTLHSTLNISTLHPGQWVCALVDDNFLLDPSTSKLILDFIWSDNTICMLFLTLKWEKQKFEKIKKGKNKKRPVLASFKILMMKATT